MHVPEILRRVEWLQWGLRRRGRAYCLASTWYWCSLQVLEQLRVRRSLLVSVAFLSCPARFKRPSKPSMRAGKNKD
jgi:hypothetical protein